MTASYWIARYVSEPLRNEPKNIGIIVFLRGVAAYRFFGERDDGSLDQRKLRPLSHPGVYMQWREYWRKKAQAGDITSILRAQTTNYSVISGGEVVDVGDDSASDVCRFLYNLLVGEGALAAYDWLELEETGSDLVKDIADVFMHEELLLTGEQLFKRHPVVREEKIQGRNVVHMPSFSQRNGELHIMEYIDLSNNRINKTKERAGWMGYMFSDIKEINPSSITYSLIKPECDGGADPIEYAKSVLANESQIINWADEGERGRFVAERRRIADAV